MRVHFWHRNGRNTVVILEEGNLPHPWHHLCNMLVMWQSLNGMHRRTAHCKKGEEQKRRSLVAKEERAITPRSFSTYGRILEMTTSFRYLGRVISAADNNWPEVVRNLAKARAVWKRVARILIREGARPRVSVFFFKDVVQSVLLFGAETWVVNPRMGRVLGGSA